MGMPANPAAAAGSFSPVPSYAPAKVQGAKKSNLPIILAIVGGVCALGLIMIVVLAALLLPAIQAARQAARRVQRENQQRAASSDVTAVDPSPSGVTGWLDYSAPSGAYTVKLPGTPRLQNQVQPSANGIVTINMAVVDLGDDTGAYSVAYNDLPIQGMARSDMRKVLDGSVNGLTASMNVTVESSRDFDEYGGMVREVAFGGTTRGQAMIGNCRIILVNDRLFQLMWLGPQGDPPTQDLQGFFSSFQPGRDSQVASTPPEPPDPASSSSDIVMQVDPPQTPEPPAPPVIPAPAIPSPPAVPRPPIFRPGLRRLDELDEAERKNVYQRLLRNERMVATTQQRIDAMKESGGASESMVKQMQSSIDRTKKSLAESTARIFRISEADLEAIRREGEQKGWG